MLLLTLKQNTMKKATFLILLSTSVCTLKVQAQYNHTFDFPAFSVNSQLPLKSIAVPSSEKGIVTVNTINEPSSTANYTDILLTRMDGNGFPIFQYRYGLPNTNEIASAVIETGDKGYIIIGSQDNIYNPGQKVTLIFKIDGLGNMVWKNIYYNEYKIINPKAITRTIGTNEQYIVTGNSDNKYLFALRIDNNGNLLWFKQYIDMQVPNVYDDPSVICQVKNTYAIAGTRNAIGSFTKKDLFMITIDDLGNISPYGYRAYDVDRLNNHTPAMQYLKDEGEFVLSFTTDTAYYNSKTQPSILKVKYDLLGLWSKVYVSPIFYYRAGAHSVYKGVDGFDIGGQMMEKTKISHPLFLNVKSDGTPINLYWYNKGENLNSTYMAYDEKYKYYELHNYDKNRMSIIQTDINGYQECAIKDGFKYLTIDPRTIGYAYKAMDKGKFITTKLEIDKINSDIKVCGGSFAQSINTKIGDVNEQAFAVQLSSNLLSAANNILEIAITTESTAISDISVKIYSAGSGQQVYLEKQSTTANSHTDIHINTSTFVPGMYILNIVNNVGQICNYKLLKY